MVTSQARRLLLGQAEAVREGFASASAFFCEPSARHERRLRLARDRARALGAPLRGESGRGLDSGVPGMTTSDLIGFSDGLEGALSSAAGAAREMLLFEVPTDRFLIDMGRHARRACEELERGLGALLAGGRRCDESLLRARKGASEVERVYLRGRSELLRGRQVVGRLKAQAVYRGLCESAAGLALAAELLGDASVRSTC